MEVADDSRRRNRRSGEEVVVLWHRNGEGQGEGEAKGEQKRRDEAAEDGAAEGERAPLPSSPHSQRPHKIPTTHSQTSRSQSPSREGTGDRGRSEDLSLNGFLQSDQPSISSSVSPDSSPDFTEMLSRHSSNDGTVFSQCPRTNNGVALTHFQSQQHKERREVSSVSSVILPQSPPTSASVPSPKDFVQRAVQYFPHRLAFPIRHDVHNQPQPHIQSSRHPSAAALQLPLQQNCSSLFSSSSPSSSSSDIHVTSDHFYSSHTPNLLFDPTADRQQQQAVFMGGLTTSADFLFGFYPNDLLMNDVPTTPIDGEFPVSSIKYEFDTNSVGTLIGSVHNNKLPFLPTTNTFSTDQNFHKKLCQPYQTDIGTVKGEVEDWTESLQQSNSNGTVAAAMLSDSAVDEELERQIFASSSAGQCPAAECQHQLEEAEELDTLRLAQHISQELKRYSIPQAIFAQRVLCRSQGTLSDLLRNPKPWSKLKSGRETFRRMAKWLEEPEGQRMSTLRLAACKRKEEQTAKEPLGNILKGTSGGVPAVRRTAQKKPRLVFTDIQRRTLQAIFKETKRPSRELQIQISQQLNLDPTTVANYFMNARRRGHNEPNSVLSMTTPSSSGSGGSTPLMGLGEDVMAMIGRECEEEEGETRISRMEGRGSECLSADDDQCFRNNQQELTIPLCLDEIDLDEVIGIGGGRDEALASDRLHAIVGIGDS
uniref:One cut domain family member n=1 Tax=Globodera rostochiensis TaxID=31243 RepID=A0A914GYD8_GLORO